MRVDWIYVATYKAQGQPFVTSFVNLGFHESRVVFLTGRLSAPRQGLSHGATYRSYNRFNY